MKQITNEKIDKEWEKLLEDEEKEEIELIKIRESANKKLVSDDVYSDCFDPSDCRYCMNYIDETDGCKKGISFMQWENHHHNGDSDCEEWDYVFKSEDEI